MKNSLKNFHKMRDTFMPCILFYYTLLRIVIYRIVKNDTIVRNH